MIRQETQKLIAKLPDAPGVYLFKSERQKAKGKSEILYIGKATSLRDRVRSYFRADIVETRSPLISKMLGAFDDITFIKTDSVLEALVLEAHLIKKHQPEANIKEKDNKSFNFVIITDEDYPRVLIERGRNLLQYNVVNLKEVKIKYSFGPFPNGTQLKEALKIVRKMFPFRDKCIPCSEETKKKNGLIYDISYIKKNCKPCFNRQIGLCPGVCTGEISKEEYAKQIKNIILFFEGNKKSLVKNLEKQMKSFAKTREFEKANLTKRTLFILNHIQDVSLIKEDLRYSVDEKNGGFRIESYDIAHMAGQNVVGVMTVMEDGEVKKSDYRKFKIRGTGETFSRVLGKNPQTPRKNFSDATSARFINDTKALAEVLSRRLGHIEWRFPDLVVVDGGTAQKRVMEKVLQESKVNIPVVSVVKDERHRPREILGDRKWLKYEREILLSNSEAHRYGIAFHKHLREKLS